MTAGVLPPETLEGWYALHQIFTKGPTSADGARPIETAAFRAASVDSAAGWSVTVELIGSTADVMCVHFRDSLEAIRAAQLETDRSAAEIGLVGHDAFLSVTEAGLYHLSAELADAEPGVVAQRVAAERENPHVKRRLYPDLPAEMPYVCFYPMSKRRNPEQNWYTLSLDERSRLMQTHGKTGRRYAGRVQQIITGAIGYESWEWGVTLFAKDPLDFKKLVTDMRFDEVSAKYAEFGRFYVGKMAAGR